MAIDSTIALQARPMQIDSPLEAQTKALTLRNLLGQNQLQTMQVQQAQRQMQQDDDYAQALRNGVGADGKLDYGGTLGALARSGNAKGYGALLKQQADAAKATADLGHTNAQTGELQAKTAKMQTDAVGGALASLLSRPQVTHDDVIQEVSGLVQRGVISADHGAQLVRTLPGDPTALRGRLMESALAVMDASKRMEALLPQYKTVDTGGGVQLTDMNPLTRGAAATTFQKTMTPGEIAQNARARERLDFDKAQGANQFIPVEGVGLYVGNKRDGTARQVTDPSGKPVVPNKALTEGQAKANLFGTRMQEADRIINDFAAKGITAPSVAQQLTGGNGISGSVATAAATPQQQQIDQAQRDFINAVLRRESGAAISPGEFDSARKQYFVQPGDSPAVISQKARNRAIATQGMLAEVPDDKRGIPNMPPAQAAWAADMPADIAAILKKHGGK